MPKINNLPNNISVVGTLSGSMDANLMRIWTNEILIETGISDLNHPIYLLLNSYGSHIHIDVIEFLKNEANAIVCQIPPGMTSIFQPQDAGINSAFKVFYDNEYDAWVENGKIELTKSGNFIKVELLKLIWVLYLKQIALVIVKTMHTD